MRVNETHHKSILQTLGSVIMAIWLAEEVMLEPQLFKDDREGMGEGKTMNSAWDVQAEGHRV